MNRIILKRASENRILIAVDFPTTVCLVLQHQLSKRELATISAGAERYIGTQGGGMDQAIAFLGKAGNCLVFFTYMRRVSQK